MKRITTEKYLKLSSDLKDHPPVKPTDKDNGPGKFLFIDDKDTEESIQEEWQNKKKKKKKKKKINRFIN
mgnify:CR=1 FL=1